MCFCFLVPDENDLPAIKRPLSFTEPYPLSKKIRPTSGVTIFGKPTRDATLTLGDTTQTVATINNSEIILPYGTISILRTDDWRTCTNSWIINGMLNFDVRKIKSRWEFSIRGGGMEYRLVCGGGGTWSYQYSVLVIEENGEAVPYRKIMAINSKGWSTFHPRRYTFKFSEDVSVPLVACVAYILLDVDVTSDHLDF